MGKYIFILFVFIAPMLLKAQSNTGGTLSSETSLPGLLQPVDVNFLTGASFGTFGRTGNYFQSFLSPSLSLPLNKKLSVSAGLTYSHTTFNNIPMLKSEGQVENYSGGLNTLTLFTSGHYRANDRLTLSGSAYKSLNPSFNARLNPEALQMEARGFSFGVDYKLGENTHIGAEIRYQQGNGNLINPYNNFNSPFQYNSPFNNGYGFPSGY